MEATVSFELDIDDLVLKIVRQIDLSDVAEHIDTDDIAESIDLSNIAKHVDVQEVVENIDTDDLVSSLSDAMMSCTVKTVLDRLVAQDSALLSIVERTVQDQLASMSMMDRIRSMFGRMATHKEDV